MQIVQLFCIPFAGGNQYSFRELKNKLPAYIQCIPLDYSGRGARMREPLMNNIPAMTEDIFNQVKKNIHGPYAIYGHSMGAVIAFELAHLISQSDLPNPLHLYVSGRGAPSIKAEREDIAQLPSAAFREKIKELGGSPDEVLKNNDLMELFEPILRNDFYAHYRYTYLQQEPLKVPLTVLYGKDENFTKDKIDAWKKETLANTVVQAFDGGHFFIFDHWKTISEIITNSLKS